jgi:hypothetical protein
MLAGMGRTFALRWPDGLALELFNNRELATVLWLFVGAVALLFSETIRTSLGSIARLLVEPFLLATLLSLVVYLAVLGWAGHGVGIWSTDLISETIWWFVGTALVLLVNVNDALKERRFFRRVALQTMGITLLLDFFMNDLFVLSFPFELLLLPVLTFLGLLSLVAQRDPASREVASATGCLQAAAGFSIAAFVVFKVSTNLDQVTTEAHLLELLLPVWLTVSFLPFVYVVSVLVAYDSAFRRIDWSLRGQQGGSWRVKLALATVLRGRARDSAGFVGGWVERAGTARSFREARRAINAYRTSLRKREKVESEKRGRLEGYAGVQGTDEEGLQLDRREFAETKAALRSLASAQMGWYRNPGNRYRDDLLDIFAPVFQSDGLPREHGVTMRVTEDGQAWYAWRRTITGWCFAIGASAPPPDQWEFDGPEPPRGFPGQDAAWGENPFAWEANRNWGEPMTESENGNESD